MDAFEKLAHVNLSMTVETAEDVSPPPSSDYFCSMRQKPADPEPSLGRHITPADLPITLAALPGGRRIPLLKTVLTSACERNCNYCCFRAGRDTRRTTFQPDELAQAFLDLHQSGLVQGIFLSSGVAGGGMRTEDRLIAAAELLRLRHHFQGYIHLKIMPGAERDQVLRAMQLADRVSVNLEGPTPAALSRLAPQKVFMEELLQPLRWVEEIRRNQPAWKGWKQRWSSSVTQFVVGAVGESDLELMQVSAYLHSQLHLTRVYYSRFKPTPRTPFEDRPEVNPWREHRLYQADFLLRDYGFSFEELPFNNSGSLPLDRDPKLAWAQANLGETPLEINRADLSQLLRLPGIGPRGARAIIAARRKERITSLNQLRALDVIVTRLLPFILMDGRRPTWQMRLF